MYYGNAWLNTNIRYDSPMERRLAFDPTPESTALALRVRYKYLWKLIRNERFKAADFLCEICGSDRGKREWLDGHEIYSFEKPKVIRLERVVFICKHCHEAIHLERTRVFSGKEWVAEVEAHYCRVNGITAEEMKADYAEYFAQYRAIGKTHPKYECTMDYGPWKEQCDAADARWKAKGTDGPTLLKLRIAREAAIRTVMDARQVQELLFGKKMKRKAK